MNTRRSFLYKLFAAAGSLMLPWQKLLAGLEGKPAAPASPEKKEIPALDKKRSAINPLPILVAGAGHGGLVAAYHLARAGYEVVVLEKKRKNALGWDWHDNFLFSSFAHAAFDPPRENTYSKASDFTFVSPDGKTSVVTNIPDAEKEIVMDRKVLIRYLLDKAESAGVKIKYETLILGPLLENDMVTGLVTEKESIRASLVIDAAGLTSPVRTQLPESYAIKRDFARGEVIHTYRGYYNILPGVAYDDKKFDTYIGLKGRRGIGWVRTIDNSSDVLLGKLDAFAPDEIGELTADLHRLHPETGSTLVRGGYQAVIPLRRPLDLMVGHNYAALGDAAAMTIPVIGSGIGNALVAGKMLADVIIAGNKSGTGDRSGYTARELWPYQASFYLNRAHILCGYDLLKYYLFTADWEDINFVFKNRIIKATDFEGPLTGRAIKVTAGDMLDRFTRGWYRPGKLLELRGVIADASRAKKIAGKIPLEYDIKAITEWRKDLADCFRPYEKKMGEMK